MTNSPFTVVASVPERTRNCYFTDIGFHHGEGVWRVLADAVGVERIFTGMTSDEAMSTAIMGTYRQIGPFTININTPTP